MAQVQVRGANATLYEDSSVSSAVLGTLAAGTVIEYDDSVTNCWYHTSQGWLYAFGSDSAGKIKTIVMPVQVETTEIQTGGVVDVGNSSSSSTTGVIKDKNGNMLQPGSYVVQSYDSSTGYVTIRGSDNKLYQVQESSINSITTSGIVRIPNSVMADAAATNSDSTTPNYYDRNALISDVLSGNIGGAVAGLLGNAVTAGSELIDTLEDLGDTLLESVKKAAKGPGELRANVAATSLQGVFGAPYQFLPIVDPRQNNSESGSGYLDNSDNNLGYFGSIFGEKIVARMPLLVMIPGVAEFLPGASEEEMQGVIGSLTNAGTAVLDSIANKPIKYFGLKPDWVRYFDYVNAMCNAAEVMLEIPPEHWFAENRTLGVYDWSNNLNEVSRNTFLCYRGGVMFYTNAEPSYSESFSNSTVPSQLLSKINGLSEIGREINLIAGNFGGGALGKLADTFGNGEGGNTSAEIQSKIANIASGAGGGGGISGILGEIFSGATTLIAGGHLMFPEIWSDSQYSRDLSFSIKLVSPDNDKISLYHNIIVPLLHIIAFTAPHNVDVNGYISPFLVKVYYKGMFNCDLGIINTVSITKGGEGNWNQSGIPTVVDVNINIKELYSQFTISNNNEDTTFYDNLQLMDYVGNLCGINIAEPCWERKIALWNLSKNRPVNAIRRILTQPKYWDQAFANWRNKISNNTGLVGVFMGAGVGLGR